MLRMQEMTFPGFKFQKFSGGVLPQTTPIPPFMRGILATHVAFSHCYPPLIYYLTEKSLFKKCPPTGKSLKKALEHSRPLLDKNFEKFRALPSVYRELSEPPFNARKYFGPPP
jgi:hypothetical protein